MKKVLIVIDNLNVGGVATSLYNYLYAMSGSANYDLLVFNEESIQLDEIPQTVNVLLTPKVLHLLGKTNKEMWVESPILTFVRVFLQIVARYTNGVFSRKLLMPFIKTIGNYDIAIAYSQDDAWNNLSKGCADFVLKKVNSKKKAVIVHCDYEMFGGYHANQEKQYKAFDNIICVSESCRRSFCKCFPNISEKTIVCENFINIEKIKKMSIDAIQYPENVYNFVSISRLSMEKGLHRTVEAFAKLSKEGLTNFTWTIVGDGPEYEPLDKIIKDKGLQNRISMVGQKDNPYIFLKNADALLLTSYNEAAPMVFGESATLSVPIVTTETCSAIEMVEERRLGLVVPNTEEGIVSNLRSILLGKVVLKYELSGRGINESAFAQANKLLNYEN